MMCGQRLYGPSGPNGKRLQRRRYSLIYSESYSGCQSTPGKSNELTGQQAIPVTGIYPETEGSGIQDRSERHDDQYQYFDRQGVQR